MQQRETIFCEKLLLNPPPKHVSKRDLKLITQKTGLNFNNNSSKEEKEIPKQKLSLSSQKNLAQSQPSESPSKIHCKARGVFTKGINDQSNDYNLLGIKSSKKHFATVDNQQTKASLFEARQLLKSVSKQEKVHSYLNSDQIKSTFSQDEPKYYRGLLG